MQEILEYLKKSGVFYVATEEDGQPRVRPFGAVAAWDGHLYIVTSNEKDVYRQMVRNPRVEISGMADQNTWLRLTAETVVDDRREARAHMLEENPVLNNLYALDDGKMAVLYLKNVTASICSFTESTRTVRF